VALRAEADLVNSEISHFSGNLIANEVPAAGFDLTAVPVYSPAWPIDRARTLANRLVSYDVGPQDAVFGENLSDHLPIIADFETHPLTCGSSPPRASAGVCLGVSFFLQSPASMSGNYGTDAWFPSEVRQNVVVG
jgi:hypothetical protein